MNIINELCLAKMLGEEGVTGSKKPEKGEDVGGGMQPLHRCVQVEHASYWCYPKTTKDGKHFPLGGGGGGGGLTLPWFPPSPPSHRDQTLNVLVAKLVRSRNNLQDHFILVRSYQNYVHTSCKIFC